MRDFEWTEERIESLIALKREGRSSTEIANALGCGSRGSVCGKVMRLRDAGRIDGPRTYQKSGADTPAPRGRRSPGLAHVPLIKARLVKGRNDREIADEIGVKPDDVRYVRRIKGLEANTKNLIAPDYAAEVTKLVAAGKTDREVGDALGITHWQARGERRRQGLPAPGADKQRTVTTIVKGDPGVKVAAVFAEGFMGQRGRVDLIGLESGLCHFPIDQQNGPVRYCGDLTAEGQTYCAHHAARCYMPTQRMKPLNPSHVCSARR
jgi:hypothetical protein